MINLLEPHKFIPSVPSQDVWPCVCLRQKQHKIHLDWWINRAKLEGETTVETGIVDNLGYLYCHGCKKEYEKVGKTVFSGSYPHAFECCDLCGKQLSQDSAK